MAGAQRETKKPGPKTRQFIRKQGRRVSRPEDGTIWGPYQAEA